AIGAPTDKAFEGTVTRGIVSAHRTFSGLAFIQSDVAVTHGNSGGPLVDEHGAVIALTDIGWQPDGVPIGINLFTPVGDALDFLNATSQ
ncbi:MAG TPA: trypsin-like peptidase domain-containing protein, partial [Caulobacteraceae bacterium]|nr:trypsin-like peptidase domain-containing protein [Caulobacteraceae bacterium]